MPHADVPDLLQPYDPERPARIDRSRTKLAMALAFASGVSGGLFADALDSATLAPSTWDPASFAHDLFLPQFVAHCFRIRIDGEEPVVATKHLARLLGSPPSDPAIVDYRRAIVRELAETPELRKQLEHLYKCLSRFRRLVEGASGVGKWDANRRQLDQLVLVKEIVDAAASGFATAKSGLSRLAEFGRRVQMSEPYQALADLLRYDEHLATLDLKVSVGADGRIRGFRVLSVVEDSANPFVSSPWRRWAAKIELFVRGFSFGDGEVMARLVDAVFEGLEDDIVHFVQMTGDAEFYLGALGFRDLAVEAGLEVCLPDLVSPREPRALLGLFNPLLVALSTDATTVPCDVTTNRHDTTMLVTGPNSGGKTRLLQSLGLAQMLAQSGLFVPARSASLSLAPALVVSLIEEAKADQTEGRLGTELIRIRTLFERLPPGAMVILDELCSGTNPSEGEEIFELVVRMLTLLRPQAFITTHFLQFAARLESEAAIDDLRFLQVVLGPDQNPTYQFAPGVAKTSLAAHTAARLGVTAEQLLALVEHNVSKAQMNKRTNVRS